MRKLHTSLLTGTLLLGATVPVAAQPYQNYQAPAQDVLYVKHRRHPIGPGKGALIGGAGGAVIGALAGGPKGAVIGGAVGAGAGAVTGSALEHRRHRRAYRRYR
jgi:outer membrane lipoprotein SlyB